MFNRLNEILYTIIRELHFCVQLRNNTHCVGPFLLSLSVHFVMHSEHRQTGLQLQMLPALQPITNVHRKFNHGVPVPLESRTTQAGTLLTLRQHNEHYVTLSP